MKAETEIGLTVKGYVPLSGRLCNRPLLNMLAQNWTKKVESLKHGWELSLIGVQPVLH